MKTRSLILFLLIAALILAAAWGVFCGIPLGAQRFAPMEVLQGGADLQGEATIFLQLQPEEGQQVTEEIRKSIAAKLQARLDLQGFDSSSVVAAGEDGFEVRVSINETSPFRDAEQIAGILTTTGRLYIADKTKDNAVLIDRDMIDRVELQSNSLGKFSIFMMMTDEGKEKLSEVTKELADREVEEEKYVYIYLDEEQLAELSVRQEYADGYFGFSSSYTEYEAERFQNTINAGMLEMSLKSISEEQASARMGEQAWNVSLLALGAGLALVMLALIMVYRGAGIANALSVLAYSAALVCITALLGIQLNGAGIAAVAIGSAYLAVSLVSVNNAFKKQYEGGKNLRAAYRTGYSDANSAVSNLLMILVLGFIALIASGSAAMEKMAYVYGVALVLAYLCTMVVNRLLMGLLVRVNGQKAAWYFPAAKTSEGDRA